MNDILDFKQDIIQFAELGAIAILKMQNPKSDEISKNEAYRLFSRRWIDKHINAGNLILKRSGKAKNSKVILSLLEITALRRAEERITYDNRYKTRKYHEQRN